ncbi:MAG TPA: efflux RND transporter permease subunit, partial [Kiloniellaceae bacterium]|nr:efflux RND transporter permease subunit [Kiloniellaceae bacterium]
MIRFFIDHPTAANLLMAFLMILGLSRLPELQRETFPNFAPRQVEIKVPYPGAGAGDVEQAICLRLEDALDGINEVEETTCTAREGLATLVAEMIDGADFDRFFEDVKSEVEAIDSFPDVTERPIIRQLGRTDRVVAIAVTGRMALPDLKAYAEQIRDRMLQLSEISQVEVQGFSKHLLRVEVTEQTLRALGLSISDIADAIQRQNIDLPAGSLGTRSGEYLLRFTNERRTPEELGRLVVVGGE